MAADAGLVARHDGRLLFLGELLRLLLLLGLLSLLVRPPRRGWRRRLGREEQQSREQDRGGARAHSARAFFRTWGAISPKYFTTSRLQVAVRRRFSMYSSSAFRSSTSPLRTP